MSVTVGDRLGHYQVTALLGQGMMGQVYKATDTRLHREVALKLLPAELAGDADRLARFQREAQVLASLNHPGIAAIYGLEEFEPSADPSQGTVALVLELVDGPTLAQRIEQGPIPVDDAMAMARQIVEALEAAHAAGVVHRDLKPANIKVKEDGTVKVLDFGLAKALEKGSEASEAHTPAMTTVATQHGMIVGSPAYMSPEQARGRVLDKRTDVWAFGAVLYEMLTGRRAFDAEDVSLTLAEVIKGEPDFDALPSLTPASLRVVLKRCLEKDPRRRVRDIGDVFIMVEAAESVSGREKQSKAGVESPTGGRERAAWVVAGLVAVAVTWTLAGRSSSPAPRPESVEFAVGLPSNQNLALDTDASIVALSADARQLVYVGRGGNGVDQLFHRSFDRLDAVRIPGTEGALAPFLSPDGQWVGFVSGTLLRKVRLAGGPAVTITELPRLTISPRWGPNDTVYFGSPIGGLYSVSANGGSPVVLADPETVADVLGHLSPVPSSDGRVVFYTRWNGRLPEATIEAVILATGERRTLASGVIPRVSETGHIVFGGPGDGTLWRMRVDPQTLDVIESPSPVLDGVSSSPGGVTHYDIASDGTLLYVRGPSLRGANRTLVWVDREGQPEPISVAPARYRGPRLSPEGERVVVQTQSIGVGTDLWVVDLGRGVRSPLSTGPAAERNALWTPDGERVVFESDQDESFGLYGKAADGTGVSTLLLRREDATRLDPFGWSADQTGLVFAANGPRGGLGVLSLDGGTWEPLALTLPAAVASTPALSPDGGWIAYASTETGNLEVYVERFPSGGARQQVSNDGGFAPLWSGTGDELFYIRMTHQASRGDAMMRVSVASGPQLALGTPVPLFTTNQVPIGGVPNYAVSLDGSRFLFIQDEDSAEPSQLVARLNWFSGLDEAP